MWIFFFLVYLLCLAKSKDGFCGTNVTFNIIEVFPEIDIDITIYNLTTGYISRNCTALKQIIHSYAEISVDDITVFVRPYTVKGNWFIEISYTLEFNGTSELSKSQDKLNKDEFVQYYKEKITPLVKHNVSEEESFQLEISITNNLIALNFKSRASRFGIMLGISAAVLILAQFILFFYNKTDHYKVHLKEVEKHLAEDGHRQKDEDENEKEDEKEDEDEHEHEHENENKNGKEEEKEKEKQTGNENRKEEEEKKNENQNENEKQTGNEHPKEKAERSLND